MASMSRRGRVGNFKSETVKQEQLVGEPALTFIPLKCPPPIAQASQE